MRATRNESNEDAVRVAEQMAIHQKLVEFWREPLGRESPNFHSDSIAGDAQNDPHAPAGYDRMVHKLENRQESFKLWRS